MSSVNAGAASHPYASPAWLQSVCDVVEGQIAASRVDLRGCDYTVGEEILDVPAHVNPNGHGRIGWHVAIRDGVVRTAPECPPDHADSVNIADWQATEPLAHVTFEDLSAHPELVQLAATLVEDGALQVVVRREMPVALTEAFNVQQIHDAVVAITGPPPDPAAETA
jgi:hypothetical protein